MFNTWLYNSVNNTPIPHSLGSSTNCLIQGFTKEKFCFIVCHDSGVFVWHVGRVYCNTVVQLIYYKSQEIQNIVFADCPVNSANWVLLNESKIMTSMHDTFIALNIHNIICLCTLYLQWMKSTQEHLSVAKVTRRPSLWYTWWCLEHDRS